MSCSGTVQGRADLASELATAVEPGLDRRLRVADQAVAAHVADVRGHDALVLSVASAMATGSPRPESPGSAAAAFTMVGQVLSVPAEWVSSTAVFLRLRVQD